MSDQIIIDELEVLFRVGVPNEERANPQRLFISVTMDVDISSAVGGDDIEKTVDYYAVTQQIKQLGADREWKLIETLAEDVASVVLENNPVEATTVEISKFILPDTRRVGVRIKRKR